MSFFEHQYKYKITCKSYYYGYPEAKSVIEVEGEFSKATITWYGNRGFAPFYLAPKSPRHAKMNGYFWETTAFLRAFYADYLTPLQSKIREVKNKSGESTEVKVSL